MRSRSLVRRWGATVVVLLSVATGLVSSAATSSFADNGCKQLRSTDLVLKQTPSQLPSGNIQYRLDVTNFGPDCANKVKTTSALPGGSRFVKFTNLIRKWNCAGISTVVCTLQSTIPSPPSDSNKAAVSIETTAPSSPDQPSHTELTAAVDDLEPSDNVSDAGFASSIVVGDCSSSTKPQVTTSRNDHPSGMETQFPSSTSQTGEADPPCGSDCLFSSEVNNSTEGTDPNLWPEVHLTFTLCMSGVLQPAGTISRFNDKTGQWVENLEGCAGFTGDTDLGCIKSASYQDGTWVLVVWTTKNGHLAK
jgi:uncharacterized repeat protein (TIGR01451 family)